MTYGILFNYKPVLFQIYNKAAVCSKSIYQFLLSYYIYKHLHLQ